MLIRYHLCTNLMIDVEVLRNMLDIKTSRRLSLLRHYPTLQTHHFTNTLLKHNWCDVIHCIKSDMKLTLRRKVTNG